MNCEYNTGTTSFFETDSDTTTLSTTEVPKDTSDRETNGGCSQHAWLCVFHVAAATLHSLALF